MFDVLFFLIISLFVAMLFLNVFFRVKVFKYYKYLVRNRVEFGMNHFFDQPKLEQEVLTRYPEHQYEIQTFISLVRRSITMASILIVLITAFGYLLTQYR